MRKFSKIENWNIRKIIILKTECHLKLQNLMYNGSLSGY